MSEAQAVADLLRDWAAGPLGTGPSGATLESWLAGAMEHAGASCAALLRRDDRDGEPRVVACRGGGLSRDVIRDALAWEAPADAQASVQVERTEVRDADSGTRWLVHRSTERAGVTAVLLGLPPGASASPAIPVMLDWLLSLAGMAQAPAEATSPAVSHAGDREDIHRVNNALGAVAMHADLGTLLTEEAPEQERLHRLFSEIAAQTAICAAAVRKLLRRD